MNVGQKCPHLRRESVLTATHVCEQCYERAALSKGTPKNMRVLDRLQAMMRLKRGADDCLASITHVLTRWDVDKEIVESLPLRSMRPDEERRVPRVFHVSENTRHEYNPQRLRDIASAEIAALRIEVAERIKLEDDRKKKRKPGSKPPAPNDKCPEGMCKICDERRSKPKPAPQSRQLQKSAKQEPPLPPCPKPQSGLRITWAAMPPPNSKPPKSKPLKMPPNLRITGATSTSFCTPERPNRKADAHTNFESVSKGVIRCKNCGLQGRDGGKVDY